LINQLKMGKECIGQTVYDSIGNMAIITNMYTLNGSRCMVEMRYEDGIIQNREKFHVSKGQFQKPGSFNIEKALNTNLWKPLYGYEEYYIVSKYGELVRIKGNNKGRFKKPSKHTGGYYMFQLYKDGRYYRDAEFQHRCVAQTFIRPLLDREEVNHIDGDRSNNKLCNLYA
jgi:hypothetical protein